MKQEEYDGFSPINKSWCFGVGQYQRIGDLSCAMIFGFHFYLRAGKVKSLLGLVWG